MNEAERLPWLLERPALDLVTVSRLVGDVRPELAGRPVRRLGEGWDSEAFVVGDHVVRFPKRAEVQRSLDVELALLPELAPRLPLTVPCVDVLGVPTAAFPFRFAGYPLLPGVPGHELPEMPPVAKLAPALANFVTALHAFPVERARELGVPEEDADPREFARDALEHWSEVAPALEGALGPATGPDERRRVGTALRDAATAPPPPRVEACLAHADLLAEHVLVDPASGRPTAVIDWGDLVMTDPAQDLAGCWCWGGRALAEAVLSRTPHAVDARLLERARVMALAQGVGDAWYGLRRGLPDRVRWGIASLRRT